VAEEAGALDLDPAQKAVTAMVEDNQVAAGREERETALRPPPSQQLLRSQRLA
jgi:hypothetical protein